MLGNSGGDGLVAKLTSYLTAETVSTAEAQIFRSIAKCGTDLPGNGGNDNVHVNHALGSSRGGVARQTLQRSISDNISIERRTDGCSLDSSIVASADHLQRVCEVPTAARMSPKPPRPPPHRHASSPVVQSHSHYHDPNLPAVTLQQTLIDRTKFTSYQTSASTSPRLASTTRHLPGENASASKRHVATRLVPYLDRKKTHKKSSSTDQPLKPCIKLKAKSTPTSPPGGRLQPMTEDGTRYLRRIKTVDFDENGSKQSITLLAPIAMGNCPENPKVHRTDVKPRRSPAPKSSSCPIRLGTMKCIPADPAVTRTDVHVIAIAPSVNAADYWNEDYVDPATPTMQVVESKEGRHEVVWDNVPPERDVRSRERRSSSAGQALEKVTCHGKRGLDRVNTKLADWSGTWNSPSSSFKPTIVVFPDDDTRFPHYDCAIEDDEDLTVLAPPNSQSTSAGPSRHHSRPASAPITRAASDEEEETSELVFQKHFPLSIDDLNMGPQRSLIVPDPDGRVGHTTHNSQRRAQVPAIRKLSNIEDTDLKFRGHRDSVTIAHSRLVRTGSVSPELFAHRDSVSMARKRMHARNNATSAVQEIPRIEVLQSDVLSLYDDDDDDDASVVSLETVKEHALQALKKSSSVSMLRTHEEPPIQRHILIMD